ncbi:helix-turn-helix domain-containing protein [Lactiplantibacillus modestisalitolerans]|uniref:Helix-turn-helix domain-containing protein n=1 Tax=Lactiplantibacillus modestisalitolerans TaxID=1457219 RepID=A0ABV5WTS3_9LACO|nr:helix-turn-helix transcriptional regulator [Lactiplantibacillus modestisalitolerans]
MMIQAHLQSILESRTMSSERLAELTGIQPEILTELVNGQATSISFQHLNKISRVLDVGIEELFVLTPDLELGVELARLNEKTRSFSGTAHFIDNDRQTVLDLELTGRYQKSGPLYTFTINDTFDAELGSDNLAINLARLQPTNEMTPTKRHLIELLTLYPEQQAWFEPEGMPLSANPTEIEMERYLQVGNLIARTQYEKLHRLLEPLAMNFLTCVYQDWPQFLGDSQTSAVPWGAPDAFRVYNFILAESPEALAENGITKRREQARQQSSFPVSYTSLDVLSYFSND